MKKSRKSTDARSLDLTEGSAQKLARRNIETLGQGKEGQDSWVTDAPLEAADIGRVQIRSIGKGLLGEASLFAKLGERFPEAP